MKKKDLLLIGGLGVGAGLAAYYLQKTRFYHETAKFWFLPKPDFGEVVDKVGGVLSRPAFWQRFELEDFVPCDAYLGDLILKWKEDDMAGNMAALDELISEIVEMTDLPCWCRKEIYASDDESKLIGVGLGIGYSRCPGDEPEEVID